MKIFEKKIDELIEQIVKDFKGINKVSGTTVTDMMELIEREQTALGEFHEKFTQTIKSHFVNEVPEKNVLQDFFDKKSNILLSRCHNK